MALPQLHKKLFRSFKKLPLLGLLLKREQSYPIDLPFSKLDWESRMSGILCGWEMHYSSMCNEEGPTQTFGEDESWQLVKILAWTENVN